MIDTEKIIQVSLSTLQALVQDIMDNAKLMRFTDYLDDISCFNYERLLHFVKQYEKLYNDDIEQIFVTNCIQDNKPLFEDLWFFCKTRCLKMSNFLSDDKTTIFPLKNSVSFWTYEKKDYDKTHQKAAADSTCLLSVTFMNLQTANFRALGKNCVYLQDVLNKYIKENKVEN